MKYEKEINVKILKKLEELNYMNRNEILCYNNYQNYK